MRQRPAIEVGVFPSYIKNLEKHGLCFFVDNHHNGNAVGAQCKYCHTIIWVNARLDPILSERQPDNIPDSGEAYRNYYKDNLKRFLNSMPTCPVCGKQDHDLFINNVEFPRFADGTEFYEIDEDANEIPADSNEIKIWWLDQ